MASHWVCVSENNQTETFSLYELKLNTDLDIFFSEKRVQNAVPSLDTDR